MSDEPPEPPASRPLGDILVERGHITAEELERCVKLQQQRSAEGRFQRLGEVLVAEGVIKPEELRQALEAQELRILACAKCQAQFNVEEYDPAQSYDCSRCGGRLAPSKDARKLVVEDTVGTRRRRTERRFGSAGGVVEGDGRGIAWFGPYEILGEISRGGMSVVYKARQPGLDRIVALKVLIAGSAATKRDTEQFRLEARALSRLRHPNVIAVFEVGRIDGVEFFTMDYIEGPTLDQATILDGLGEQELTEVFIKVGQALDYAHSRGVLHRDIKPRNILIDRRGEPVVIDFGIARLSSEASENDLVGSPLYMAPEYIAGEPYDSRCEVYALGISLYQLLSGRHPNDDTDTRQILQNASKRRITPLRKVQSSVSASLSQAVMTACATNPASRYARLSDFARDLERARDGEELDANASPLYRAWRRVRIRVALFAAIGVSAALVFSVGFYARSLSEKDETLEGLSLERDRWEQLYLSAQTSRIEALLTRGEVEAAESLFRATLESFGGKKPEALLALQRRISEEEAKRRD